MPLKGRKQIDLDLGTAARPKGGRCFHKSRDTGAKGCQDIRLYKWCASDDVIDICTHELDRGAAINIGGGSGTIGASARTSLIVGKHHDLIGKRLTAGV